MRRTLWDFDSTEIIQKSITIQRFFRARRRTIGRDRLLMIKNLKQFTSRNNALPEELEHMIIERVIGLFVVKTETPMRRMESLSFRMQKIERALRC